MAESRLSILGGGRAGLTLAVALAERGLGVDLVARRLERRHAVAAWLPRGLEIRLQETLVAAERVVIAVPDRALAAVVAALPPAPPAAIWLHLSGAVPWQVLRRAGGAAEIGALHPLAALTDPLDLGDAARTARPLCGATFAVAGTAAAEQWALALVARLGGEAVVVADGSRALYHAAAALAANDLVALLAVAEQAAVAAGLPQSAARRGLTHLAQTALDAVRRLPAETPWTAGLTGAVARGDADTLAGHLAALWRFDPAAAALHRDLSRQLLELVRQGGTLRPASLAALDVVLAGGPPEEAQ